MSGRQERVGRQDGISNIVDFCSPLKHHTFVVVVDGLFEQGVEAGKLPDDGPKTGHL